MITNSSIINCGGNGIDTTNLDGTNIATKAALMENCIIFLIVEMGSLPLRKMVGNPAHKLLAMGENTANFSNMDSYEDMIDVISITTADFVDYNSDDFRIRRDSSLYKILETKTWVRYKMKIMNL